jgi:hypothetical protein
MTERPPRSNAMIPGSRERNTITYRQPGSIGAPAAGTSATPAGPSQMDEATTAARQREGGGAPNQRKVKGTSA